MATTNAASGGTLATRPGASRKLLTMKAGKAAAATPAEGGTLEDSFPGADHTDQAITTPDEGAADVTAPLTEPTPASTDVATSTSTLMPTASTWTEEDERTLQALAARRKAAGFPRRGRDVGAQVLSVGSIAPNPGTVAAVLVALVAERGTASRDNLVAAMATAPFSHARARPTDKGWCQGYVAGCVRDGFLVLASAAGSASAQPFSAGGTQ